LSATLSYYPPGIVQSPHDHDFTQISFLLAGELEETLGRRTFALDAGRRGCKPAGARHANRFGRHGALIFAVAIGERAGWSPGDAGWSRGPDAACVAGLARIALETADRETRAEALLDLVALAKSDEMRSVSTPPIWLRRVREEIRDASGPVGIADIARATGIDRAQLSRAFHRHYGVPPSIYRLRCMTGRAIAAALASDASISDTAHAAGFADQSHLTRTVKAAVGIPMQRLRMLLG
jgi:AraC family transcriptional regulator